MPIDHASAPLSVFPPVDPPVGFQYLPESRLAQDLSRPFLGCCFEGVPLAYALLVSVEQLVLEGHLTRPDNNPPSTRLKQALKAALYPAVWLRRSVRISNLDNIPVGGLLVRIEVADMLKEWNLVSGALARLNGMPVWLLCGETAVPAHCAATGLPSLPNDLRLEGTMSRFMREYYSKLPDWAGEIRGQLARHRFPAGAFQRLLGCLAMTLMYGVQARELLIRTRPRMIVVDCDHSPISAWLIFFARQMGIPSVTLQHGDVPDIPLWADRALLWGDQSARAFKAYGARDDSLHLVGYPRMEPSLRPREEMSAFKDRNSIPSGAKIVVLATERGIMADRLRLAKEAWDGVRGVPNHHLLIKCHPAEDDSEIYAAVFQGDSRGHVFAHSELGLDLALSMADVVLAEWSGVAKDALIKGKPVVLMNLRGELLSNQAILDHGACLSAAGSRDLTDMLERESYSWERHPELGEKARELLKATYVAYGDDAASLIASTLRSIWGSRA